MKSEQNHSTKTSQLTRESMEAEQKKHRGLDNDLLVTST